MITVSKTTSPVSDVGILLGRQGENEARQIVFDLSWLIETYGNGTATLVHQRSKDSAPYICTTTQDGSSLTWTLNNLDTAYDGWGQAELRWTVSDVRAKTLVYKTMVVRSITADSTIPDPYESWYDQMIEYIDEHGIDPEDLAAAIAAYLEEHPVEAPVQSVNNKTGAVVLSASDVGAGTYSKPSGGIPKTDLASAVQTSLGKADTALQTAPVSSVNAKTGAVTLAAGDIGYDDSATYDNGTVGKELTNLKGGLTEKVDKSAIEDAGITNRSYSVIKDITVTTVSDETHSYPYAESSGGSIDERYTYRVTINGNQYVLDGHYFFKYLGGSGSGSKGVTWVGNPSLYFDSITGICCNIDDVSFCLVEMDTEFSGIQIYTETAGEYAIKLERISYTKKDIPYNLIYGVSEPPIFRKSSNGSYDGFSFGQNSLEAPRSSYAIGTGNTISGNGGKAFGSDNRVSGVNSIAVGQRCEAVGESSVATGLATKASGKAAFSEGETSVASNEAAHSEGYATTASGLASHSEGINTTASGTAAHAENNSTTASGQNSHADGWKTIANHRSQHVFGQANVADPSSAAATALGTYAEIVGNGTADNARSNAYALDWDGNGRYAGNVYVGCNSDSTGGTRLPHDVQVDGTSVVNNGVANVPVASASNLGVVKLDNYYGISANSEGRLTIVGAAESRIKNGDSSTAAVTSSNQHASAFYGLTKAAGVDMASSDNAVGVYTDAAKVAIRKMLGLPQEWELIHDSTTTQDLAELSITVDNYGAAFELTEMYTEVFLPASTTGNTDYIKGGTYVKFSNANAPSWDALTTLKYTNASKGFFEYNHEIIGGICRCQTRNGSDAGNSQNVQSMVIPNASGQDAAVIESINGIRWQQYNNTSTLIPSGTRVKIYGRRKV